MKKSEVGNKYKNKHGKLKTLLSICYLKRKRFPDGILMKHKTILYAYGVMQQCGVKYW